jgi:hypothetical protein
MYEQITSTENHFTSASSGGIVMIKPNSSGAKLLSAYTIFISNGRSKVKSGLYPLYHTL